MPGDVADVEIVEDRGRFARGRITRLITPAAERVIARCKHFGICGGCHWQHIPYALQLQYKSQIVRELLTRIGGLPEPRVHPAIGAEDPWHYRNNIQFHVNREGRLGFMAAKSNFVVPIEECHIMTPPVEALWRELETDLPDMVGLTLRAGVNSGERLAALRLAGDEAPEAEIDLPVNCVVQLANGSRMVLAGDDHFHETLAGMSFQVSADSFFQVNTPQAERLLVLVVQYVGRGVGAGLAPAPTPSGARPHAVVLDAYCGVGTFALALAPLAQRVIGIEGAPSAVRDARFNAQAFPNVDIVEGAVEDVLPGLNDAFAVAVLDPPREGCAPAVLNALASRRVPRIVYVSCDPSTLARDVKRLTTAGYELVEAQPIDLFPQTFHIETVALLSLRA
jgi:23S rRNA (uracil1939-C5)-methyltransferase